MTTKPSTNAPSNKQTPPEIQFYGFDDEELFLQTKTTGVKPKEDENMIRHPYWLKISYFYHDKIIESHAPVKLCILIFVYR